MPAQNQFGVTITNVAIGTQPATAFGTVVTPAQAPAVGAYAQLLAATSDDSAEVEIVINDVGIAAVARDCLVTIGWDPAGGSNFGATAATRIDNLLAACASQYVGGAGGIGGGVRYMFQLKIPAGSTVAAKASVNSANLANIRVLITLRCQPTNDDLIYIGDQVDTYGINAATASGTVITPGTVARGAWVSMGALTNTYFQMQVGIGMNDANMGNLGYEVDAGVGVTGGGAATSIPISREVFTTGNAETLTKQSTARGDLNGAGAGNDFFVRAQCNGTPDSAISAAVYAVRGGAGIVVGGLSTPTLSNIDPDPSEIPGAPGAFSVDFRLARLTPIEFDITNVSGNITITVHFDDRNEPYTALDVDGVFRWPFDVPADNTIGSLASEPVHVSMLPRGGWPPCVVHFQVANCAPSS